MPPARPRAARIANNTLAHVIRQFVTSAQFNAYKPSTQYGWRLHLALMERPDVLGTIHTDVIRPALVQAAIDGLADFPGKQENCLKALKQLEKWAIVRDLLPRSITTGVRIIGSRGGHEPWRDEHIELAERHARRGFDRVVTLAANTGQRGSDLVKMRWSDIEIVQGRPGINVTQKKTGLVIWVPFTQQLIAQMATWERKPGFILTGPTGVPWTRKRLSTQWAVERDTNPLLKPLVELELCMHGLRSTACVRLSQAGATTGLIASMVGMSEKMVARYCRLSKQKENALAAVALLDRTAQERGVIEFPKKA